jgi:hypothetical protein
MRNHPVLARRFAAATALLMLGLLTACTPNKSLPGGTGSGSGTAQSAPHLRPLRPPEPAGPGCAKQQRPATIARQSHQAKPPRGTERSEEDRSITGFGPSTSSGCWYSFTIEIKASDVGFVARYRPDKPIIDLNVMARMPDSWRATWHYDVEVTSAFDLPFRVVVNCTQTGPHAQDCTDTQTHFQIQLDRRRPVLIEVVPARAHPLLDSPKGYVWLNIRVPKPPAQPTDRSASPAAQV